MCSVITLFLRFDKCSVSTSPPGNGTWYDLLESTRCLVGCLVIILYKTGFCFFKCFLVFLDFCFTAMKQQF